MTTISGVGEILNVLPGGGGYVMLAKTLPDKGARGISLFYVPIKGTKGVSTTILDDWGRRGISTGGFALEDAAFAGWLVERLAVRGARVTGAAAAFARGAAPRDAGEVRAVVQGCAHGRYLRSLGPDYARDVEFCAGLDTIGEAFGPA